ncbi:hypothetical protein [Fructilactobacillus hinvesii]|nr:hypothetical protein [Fructilactobacillus hinvesii]
MVNLVLYLEKLLKEATIMAQRFQPSMVILLSVILHHADDNVTPA